MDPAREYLTKLRAGLLAELAEVDAALASPEAAPAPPTQHRRTTVLTGNYSNVVYSDGERMLVVRMARRAGELEAAGG